MSRFLPPSKVTNSRVTKSILGDGCVVRSGCTINNSVIGLRSLIGPGCTVESSLLMGADYYETLSECVDVVGCLPIGLGAGTTIEGAIVDKNARIGAGCVIKAPDVAESNHEDEGWVVRDGVLVIVKDAVIADNTKIGV